MWTELLGALQSLCSVVTSFNVTDIKRHKVAKQLLKIHLDIERIVSRGWDILSIFNNNLNNSQDICIDQLREQQYDLKALADDLNNPKLKSLLGLYIPDEFKNIQLFIQGKKSQVDVFLNQLVTGNLPPATDMPRLLHKRHRWDHPVSIDRVCAWEEETATMHAIPQHIQEAERVLYGISSLNENLRLFITKNFQIEDIL